MKDTDTEALHEVRAARSCGTQTGSLASGRHERARVAVEGSGRRSGLAVREPVYASSSFGLIAPILVRAK